MVALRFCLMGLFLARADADAVAAQVSSFCEEKFGSPTPQSLAVTITQTGTSTVRVDVPDDAKYVWVTDYDNYILAYNFNSAGDQTLTLQTCNAERTQCEPTTPSSFQAFAHWGSPDCYQTTSVSVDSWNTKVENYVAGDPESTTQLTKDQYAALNDWKPDTTESDFSKRSTGGGVVKLVRPGWLAPLDIKLMFVKDQEGNVIYMHEFTNWPPGGDTFTTPEFVLGGDITSMVACVNLPNLQCDGGASNCPDDGYNGGTQKCSEVQFTSNLVAEIEGKTAQALQITEAGGVKPENSVSVSLFESSASGTSNLVIVPNCGAAGSTIFVKDNGELLGLTHDSSLQVAVDPTHTVEISFLCNDQLLVGTTQLANLEELAASGNVNQNNEPRPNNVGCVIENDSGVHNYVHGEAFKAPNGGKCTCSMGAAMCNEPDDDDDGGGMRKITYSEKIIVGICSLILGLTIMAVGVFFYKKQTAAKGKGYAPTVEIPPPGTSTSAAVPSSAV